MPISGQNQTHTHIQPFKICSGLWWTSMRVLKDASSWDDCDEWGKQQSQTVHLLITHTAVHMENDLQAKVKGSYQTVAWADMSAWLMLSMWVILVQYLAKSNWKELSDNPICSKHCTTKHTEHMRVFLVKYIIKIRTSYLLLKRNRANILLWIKTVVPLNLTLTHLFFSTTTKYISDQSPKPATKSCVKTKIIEITK